MKKRPAKPRSADTWSAPESSPDEPPEDPSKDAPDTTPDTASEDAPETSPEEPLVETSEEPSAEDSDDVPAEAEAEAEAKSPVSGYTGDVGLLEALHQLDVRRTRSRDVLLGCICIALGLIIGLVIGNLTASSSRATPAALSPGDAASRGLPLAGQTPTTDTSAGSGSGSAKASTAAGTVTFVVTGQASGGVEITYGTNSSGNQSTEFPFSATLPLTTSGSVLYYDVYVQLHGAGNISCEVAVNGQVLKTGTASTGSPICAAQISQDPSTGVWQGE